jgi:hypothetical protein
MRMARGWGESMRGSTVFQSRPDLLLLLSLLLAILPDEDRKNL